MSDLKCPYVQCGVRRADRFAMAVHLASAHGHEYPDDEVCRDE